jgi:hypothetical protein
MMSGHHLAARLHEAPMLPCQEVFDLMVLLQYMSAILFFR